MFKKIITLTFIFVLSALLLDIVYQKTNPLILQNVEKETTAALAQIMPFAEEFQYFESKDFNYYCGYKNNEIVGYIFPIETAGYSGDISLLVGIDVLSAVPTICGIKIISHQETPGLGSKIATPDFYQQFSNLSKEQIYLKKDSPQGKIDAITSATISSRAVVEGVRECWERFELVKK